MARYRLRFVLQEFDLPPGITVIGRSLDCHLTIEDPLVSRRHAHIVVDDEGARIEDLGSRNGVKVNGAPIVEPTSLRSGDRIRIGTQELLFSCVDTSRHAHRSRTTGQLRLCASCGRPYPREMLACPSCEAIEQMEDTLTASGSSRLPHSWTVQLVVDALDRALRLGRSSDAERLFRRATAQIDEAVAAGVGFEARALAALMSYAASAAMSGDPAPAVWVIEMYGRVRQIPPAEVLEQLAGVAARHPAVLRAPIQALVEWLTAAGPPQDSEGWRSLEHLVRESGLEPCADGTGKTPSRRAGTRATS